MEGKYYLKEIEEMDSFDFAERLRFFIKKSGLSQIEFYEKLFTKYELAERTFRSYLANKEAKSVRHPKPETIEKMAEILNVPSGFLIWDTTEFKKFLEKYKENAKHMTHILPLMIDIDKTDIEFELHPELLLNKDEYIDWLEDLFNEQNNPNDEKNEPLYCFIQLLLEIFANSGSSDHTFR